MIHESCENPPSELVRSIVNHPNLVEHTDHNDENLSMEDMLFKRLRAINGVSDKEARNIAKNEAPSMGELDSLDVGYNEKGMSKEYNTN